MWFTVILIYLAFEFQTGKEIYLSYLPLAHILERAVVHVIISGGGKIGFYQGQVLQLMNDLGTLKPTIFVSVPRLFNRIFDKVMKGVETKGVLAQVLFRYAYYSKLAYLNHGFLRHLVWEYLDPSCESL